MRTTLVLGDSAALLPLGLLTIWRSVKALAAYIQSDERVQQLWYLVAATPHASLPMCPIECSVTCHAASMAVGRCPSA